MAGRRKVDERWTKGGRGVVMCLRKLIQTKIHFHYEICDVNSIYRVVGFQDVEINRVEQANSNLEIASTISIAQITVHFHFHLY